MATGFHSSSLGRWGYDFRCVNFIQNLDIDILSVWINIIYWNEYQRTLVYSESTLVQVMAWCHQAASHYMKQCWPGSPMPYSVTRPECVERYIYFWNWYNINDISSKILTYLIHGHKHEQFSDDLDSRLHIRFKSVVKLFQFYPSTLFSQASDNTVWALCISLRNKCCNVIKG